MRKAPFGRGEHGAGVAWIDKAPVGEPAKRPASCLLPDSSQITGRQSPGLPAMGPSRLRQFLHAVEGLAVFMNVVRVRSRNGAGTLLTT